MLLPPDVPAWRRRRTLARRLWARTLSSASWPASTRPRPVAWSSHGKRTSCCFESHGHGRGPTGSWRHRAPRARPSARGSNQTQRPASFWPKIQLSFNNVDFLGIDIRHWTNSPLAISSLALCSVLKYQLGAFTQHGSGDEFELYEEDKLTSPHLGNCLIGPLATKSAIMFKKLLNQKVFSPTDDLQVVTNLT